MLLKFLGHACFYLEFDRTKIIVDPFLKGNPQAMMSPEEVTCDWVLVSHGHGDHLGDAVQIAGQNDATIITIPELAHYCADKGVKAHGMYIGGKHSFGNFTVKLTLALHGSSMGTQYLGNPCGFLIFAGGKTIYYSGDTGLFGDMALISRLHPIDLAVLPIGDNYTMGPEDALEAVKMLKPKKVIPVHYNTWDLIKQDPQQFKTEVEAKTGVPVQVLRPGETYTL
ncbi:MAG: metal-dependent hydrolase [Thermincola sp.]|jgi:L-ascorbate metabolism protein UlaG (beta-lactamase superfamily)|nr:metal-dependent hydrolase [Thermincola sp.]